MAHCWWRLWIDAHLGKTTAEAVSLVKGIEADPVSVCLAGARLSLRAGRALDRQYQPDVRQGDMFVCAADFAAADSVLMNPPFRRYEEQGGPPVPLEVLAHYSDRSRRLGTGRVRKASRGSRILPLLR